MKQNLIVQNIYRNTISLFDGKVTLPPTPYKVTLPITLHINKSTDQTNDPPSHSRSTHNSQSNLPLISLKAKRSYCLENAYNFPQNYRTNLSSSNC